MIYFEKVINKLIFFFMCILLNVMYVFLKVFVVFFLCYLVFMVFEVSEVLFLFGV